MSTIIQIARLKRKFLSYKTPRTVGTLLISFVKKFENFFV